MLAARRLDVEQVTQGVEQSNSDGLLRLRLRNFETIRSDPKELARAGVPGLVARSGPLLARFPATKARSTDYQPASCTNNDP